MKIKLDENLPVSLAGLLRGRGLDAETVDEEGLAGAPDPQLLQMASDEGRMIFTLDKGFGDLRAYPPGTHAGIVVFRLDDTSAPAVTAAVVGLVEHHDLDDLRGTVAAVQRGTLRVRRPE